jgi:hypothetical protein
MVVVMSLSRFHPQARLTDARLTDGGATLTVTGPVRHADGEARTPVEYVVIVVIVVRQAGVVARGRGRVTGSGWRARVEPVRGGLAPGRAAVRPGVTACDRVWPLVGAGGHTR